jgi:membrane-bound lytic murein transglycosylase C
MEILRSIALPAILCLASTAALAQAESDPFADLGNAMAQEFEEFSTAQKTDWESFNTQIRAEQEAFVAALREVWGSETEASDTQKWVEYSKDRQVKRTVDFENNQIRISVLGEPSASELNKIVEKELETALTTTNKEANKEYPLVAKMQAAASKAPNTPATKEILEELKDSDTIESTIRAVTTLAKQATVTTKQISHVPPKPAERPVKITKRSAPQKKQKQTTTVAVIDLSSSWPVKRASKYRTEVEKFSEKMDIPRSLAYAIMYAESSFNPVAVSPIPAYGLMQIVPNSAGRDVTKLHFGKEEVLSPEYLFTAAKNIEVGIGYLNILDKRYLRKITDPLSRKYCTIAAYNTGAGNVAKAFTGKLNISRAAKIINTLSPAEVFTILETKLPYEETRRYIRKVSSAEKKFIGL